MASAPPDRVISAIVVAPGTTPRVRALIDVLDAQLRPLHTARAQTSVARPRRDRGRLTPRYAPEAMQRASSSEELPPIHGARIGLVQSRWYAEQTDRLVDAFTRTIASAGAPLVERHLVPGAYEIVYAADRLARSGHYDALVCTGAILKGETLHFEMIVEHLSRGLTRITLDHGIPVINEILPCTTLEQLHARTGDDEHNKGIEAAVACAEIVDWSRRQGT